jgi:nucleotide-binding universal stress UspA family protein
MKNILVPVDFSDNSKNALEYAMILARGLDRKITLLHTTQPKPSGIAVQDPGAKLQVWCRAITQAEPGFECSLICTKGKLTDEIDRLVRTNIAELVVMGTTGAAGLKKTFAGSTTFSVIEGVNCPVVAVPESYVFDSISRITFATDYHDSDVPSLRFLTRLAGKMDAYIDVVHVANEDRKLRHEEDLLEYFKEQVQKSIQYERMSFHLLEGDDVVKELKDFMTEQKSDLLALSAEERFLKGALFNQGITKEMVCTLNVPLFTFRAYEMGDNDLF